MLTLTLLCETKWTGFYAILLVWSSQNDELFATSSDVGGEEKELISFAGSGLQTYKSSEEFAGDLSMPDRTQANHEEMNLHFSRPHIAFICSFA